MIAYLPSKLHRPPLSANLVARPHLVAQLNGALARGYKVSLVVAPAGFGKTTLVNEWIEALSVTLPQSDDLGVDQPSENPTTKRVSPKCAWLSLDGMDNDLARFFQYVVSAIQNLFPTTGADSLRLLQALQLPPVAYLATTLLQEWTALPEACLLVLEDYHAITETSIHQLVARLLEHLPRQIHLVLISRTEPPLPLARLRVRQQMTEIRAADLCFSPSEIQTFLTQALGRTPTLETVTALYTRTEGWVAGLQLAALALTGSRRATLFTEEAEVRFARTFAGSNRHVMAYLVEEAFTQQPPLVQMFLLRTSILERFCAALAEALLEHSDERRETKSEDLLLATHQPAPANAQAILAYLIQANLFVVPLDEQGEWYRYHHLFRDLLRYHLRTHISAPELDALYRRASAWLADQGWIEEALQHTLASGDLLNAARLVTRGRLQLINREDWRALERWLALLPETLVQQQAALLMARTYLFSFQFKLSAIPPLLQGIATRLDAPNLTETDGQVLQGELDAHWSQIWYWQNEGQRSLAAAKQALDQLPATCLYTRSGALFYLGLAAQMTGQSALGVQTLRAELQVEQWRPSTFVARANYSLAFMHYFAGELTLMQQTAQICLQVATQANLGLSSGWAHYLLGVVAYEWNELETAAYHWATLRDLRYSTNPLAIHNGWLRLAWLEQMKGCPGQAQAQVAALIQFHHEQGNLAFLPLVYSFQARLALQQADLAAALRWAETVTLDPMRGPLVQIELPLLTHAKILLAHGAPASLAQAHLDLAPLREVAEFTHNTIRLIEILTVQARIEAAQGQTEVALATLHRAVLLAKPGRCLRTFVDLGPTLAGLLYALAKRNIETDYLGEVLAAFPPSIATTDPAQTIRRMAQARLIEPLTERESEVLLHLQTGTSNKIIARELSISVLTVKKHTISLYQKLGVQSRQQAVARARALGILASE
ncbi:MAG: LuxR C-terminal-related transcriptional regulator [Caldilineaceae bacterium]